MEVLGDTALVEAGTVQVAMEAAPGMCSYRPDYGQQALEAHI